MNELSLIQQISIIALPVIFAVTVHEAAHGWVADKLGDKTARALGRVTFNPLPHIDLVGTIILPIGLYALSSLAGGAGLLFGWAKPVPVMVERLGNPRRDSALVALAGPGANLLMAVLWGILARLGAENSTTLGQFAEPMVYMGLFGILINLFLMILNLLPILPLDGGRVLNSLLPPILAQKYTKLEPFGIIILLVLLVAGILGPIIMPVIGHRKAFSRIAI